MSRAKRPTTIRLDQILDDLGYATDSEVRAALKRQRSHGGRLGENLVELGYLSRRQLMEALSRQFGLPWQRLVAADVPGDLVERIPPPGRHGGLMVPLEWNPDEGRLRVGLNDPADSETLDALKEAFDATELELVLVPDDELRGVRATLLGTVEHASAPTDEGGVHLPDLFAAPEGDDTARDVERVPDRRVLMVTPGAQRRSFLPAIFAREGWDLVVADGFDEVADALRDGGFEAVLVDAEREEAFRMWVRGGKLPPLPRQVGVFPSVSEALLANPVPYRDLIRSLRAMVEALADTRTRDRETPPPYGLLARDAQALARIEGLPVVVSDGLHLAIHLLVPPRPPGAVPGASGVRGPFESFPASRELAVRLRFPWPVEGVLDRALALFLGARTPEPPGRVNPEVVRAAQILSLVWFHHILAPAVEATEGDAAIQMRTVLRQAATRLASLDLVEKYLRVIEERRASGDVGEVAQILLVGGDRVAELGSRLARAELRPVVTRDLMDAQAMAERRPPAAILVDEAAVPGHVDHFARVAKLDAALLLYVITDSADPAVTLGLLDVGIDDVFSPPHDFDLVAARVSRAIASRSRVRSAFRARGGDFSATFEAFSFLDLAQALGHGLKSVRVELVRPTDGEEAVLYLARGRPVHAVAGSRTGPEAIYRIISWEEDGEFTVHPESDFPPPSIHDSLESLLMEGCRLLDERRA
jgi:DNA-binding response OmpR family regulator